jgi:hypothetical protein
LLSRIVRDQGDARMGAGIVLGVFVPFHTGEFGEPNPMSCRIPKQSATAHC